MTYKVVGETSFIHLNKQLRPFLLANFIGIMDVKKIGLLFNVLVICLAHVCSHAQQTQDEQSELFEILITSGLRTQGLDKQPSSTTVQTQQDIQDAGADHFESLIYNTPNLSFAGESSRPRYFQLRGIGERTEYIGSPNASIGVIVDDIDFTGLGSIGGLLDAKQVEVLHGPQGTRYGVNALAGLINISTNDPTPEPEYHFESSAGDDGLFAFSAVANGALSRENNINYRIAASQHQQDGFRDNLFLGRDDTNGIDETYFRSKFQWLGNQGTSAKFTFLHADLDNGFDALSRDNSFQTLTNRPGEDDLQTDAAALKLQHSFNRFDLISNTAYADTDSDYLLDADLVFPGFYPFAPDFDVFINYQKNRKTYSQEFRLLSNPSSRLFRGRTDWVAGIYTFGLDEKSQSNNAFPIVTTSDYQTRSFSVFGQLDTRLTDSLILTTGLRSEYYQAKYRDSINLNFSPDDLFWSGQVALTYQLNDKNNFFTSASRGYKAAGFNTFANPNFPTDLREYDAEFLNSFEIGWRHQHPQLGLSSNVSMFYMQRKDMQLSQVIGLDDGSFIIYQDNLDRANSYGIEWDLRWQFHNNWNLDASLGLLQSEFVNYRFAENFLGEIDLSGRDLPHAPNYQYHLGLEYRNPNGFFARAEINGVDDLFISNTNNLKLDAYELVNARIGFEKDNWSVYLWGKNIFDKEYATRGYFLANDPTLSDPRLFLRFGDRRQIGITLRYDF